MKTPEQLTNAELAEKLSRSLYRIKHIDPKELTNEELAMWSEDQGTEFHPISGEETGRSPHAFEIASRLRAMEWRPIETVPDDGSIILVYLEREQLSSRIQVMRTGKCSLIGGYFYFDAPKPIAWMHLPAPPDKETDIDTPPEKA